MFESLLAWSIVLIPMMFSPGQTNILVASTGATFGLRNSKSLILGINVGLALQILIVAFGISSFFAKHPNVFFSLHCLGILYIFYLAYVFATAPVINEHTQNVSARKEAFIDGILIEILNPKVWLSLIVIFAAFAKDATTATNNALAFSTLTIILNIINNFLWAIMGVYILRKLCVGKFAKMQNYFYGLMLASVGIWMLLDTTKINSLKGVIT